MEINCKSNPKTGTLLQRLIILTNNKCDKIICLNDTLTGIRRGRSLSVSSMFTMLKCVSVVVVFALL
jgi:hypothetical protein